MKVNQDYSSLEPGTKTGIIGIDRGWYIARADGEQIGEPFPADDITSAYEEYGHRLAAHYQAKAAAQPRAITLAEMLESLPQTTGQGRQIEMAVI